MGSARLALAQGFAQKLKLVHGLKHFKVSYCCRYADAVQTDGAAAEWRSSGLGWADVTQEARQEAEAQQGRLREAAAQADSLQCMDAEQGAMMHDKQCRPQAALTRVGALIRRALIPPDAMAWEQCASTDHMPCVLRTCS